MAASNKEYHVMMFPWLAFGHMIPFLELSKKLVAKKGIRVTFISTPRNIQRLPQVPSCLVDRIKMVSMTLPPVDGLSENAEATMDIQDEEVQLLKKACDGLKTQVEDLFVKDSPDLVLFDFAQCWVPEIGAKFGIRTAFFSVYSAATLAYTGPPAELKCTSPPKRRTFSSNVTVYSSHKEAELLKALYSCDKSGKSSGQRLAKTLEGCDFVTVRSCLEYEEFYFNALAKLYQKMVLPVGFILPSPNEDGPISFDNSNAFKWLEKQEVKSVLFVGFGSEYKMPVEEIHELAHGIEISALPFIWVLRKPNGLDSINLFPSGFLRRTSDRGMVCVGWAPQFEILAHPSIGGCLFHSGWGSIIESLTFGHPLILMPMVADQGLNAKQLVQNGLGIEVPRHEDGPFDRDAVANSIRAVMVDPEGESVRLNAATVSSIFANRDLHDSYIENFIGHCTSV